MQLPLFDERITNASPTYLFVHCISTRATNDRTTQLRGRLTRNNSNQWLGETAYRGRPSGTTRAYRRYINPSRDGSAMPAGRLNNVRGMAKEKTLTRGNGPRQRRMRRGTAVEGRAKVESRSSQGQIKVGRTSARKCEGGNTLEWASGKCA